MSLKVLKFSAVWCGPCKSFEPTWKEAVKNYPDIEFQAVDAEENASLTNKFRVRSVPTFVLLEDGKEVERFSGANTAAFYDMINRWL